MKRGHNKHLDKNGMSLNIKKEGSNTVIANIGMKQAESERVPIPLIIQNGMNHRSLKEVTSIKKKIYVFKRRHEPSKEDMSP